MTAPAPTTTAAVRWRVALAAERRHANRCRALARSVRCPSCLDLIAATNRAADAMADARMGSPR